MDLSGWFFEDKEYVLNVDNHVGFVYLITNTTKDKFYVGKKLFMHRKAYQRNLKRKFKLVESDWEDYIGSNEVLQEDAANGDILVREILYLCTSKGWMSYMETLEILKRNALQSDKYYNQWVSAKIHAKHLR